MFFKNNKGAISILYVIVLLIVAIVITGVLDIISKTMSMNELQGILDVAGVSALRVGVDENKWRREEFYIDKIKAENEFRNIVANSIPVGDNRLIKNLNIRKVKIYSPVEEPNIKGIGFKYGDNRDQYFIESIITLSYGKNTLSQDTIMNTLKFLNFFQGNQTEFIQVESEKNQPVKVTIRSVGRLVMR